MAAENIGALVQTKIPGYADAADIQAALRLYHYGDYDFDINEDDATELVNPSIAYTINAIQEDIQNIDLSTAILKANLNAKGDLVSASAENTLEILPVGSNGQNLIVNSATNSGLQWSTPEVTLTNTATLTNKTLTAPVISTISNTGTLTLPTSTDTLVGRATTDTLTNKTLTAPVINVAFNAQTGTTYTLALADNGKIVEVTNSSPITVSIPTNSTAFPIGSQITVIQTGTGQITFAATTPGTTTVNGTPGLKLRTQWSSAVLLKRDTEQWVVLGDVVA